MKRKLIAYSITAGISLMLSWLVVEIRGGFAGLDTTAIMMVLSDAFIVPGILLVGLGAIIWVSTTGFFDIFGYGIKQAFLWIFTPIAQKTNKKTFFDYKLEKEEKRKPTPKNILFVGLADWIISIVFFVLYYQL
ncbi:MAG: DUF3899 domain-containing protein [Clostridia bacterium]|nr:DUF3899 domain-containing protein [Clostridia bacterium]